MGCGSSKDVEGGRQNTARNDDPPIEPEYSALNEAQSANMAVSARLEINVPDTETTYPAPAPPPNNKDSIFRPQDYTSIDARVRQQLPRINVSSYDTLIKALTTDCTTDIQKLRAIFVWLYLQDIYGSFYNRVTDARTPRGYMKLMKAHNGSYESFFAQLCRSARIPCNVIRGIGKGDKYEVGQQDMSELESAWCAVYVAGGWRLVHPLWAFFQEKQTWKNGRPPPPGTKRPDINEFFWLVDANRLICFCKPRVDQWQLLKIKWEHRKFVKSPLLTEAYFGCGLLLPKKYNAVIHSDNGICVIEFDHQNYEEPLLDAQVDLDGDSSSSVTPQDVSMVDYVITASSSTTKTLVVRFPARGIYKVDVYGGLDPTKPKIVEFKLECEDIGRDPQPFPLNPQEGFGITSTADQFGISDPIPDYAIVLIRPVQQKHFSFTCTQRLEVQATLVHQKHGSDMFADFISTRTTDGEVHVTVSVPDETILEFGLQIAVRPEYASRNFTVVASYLLIDENWRKKTAVIMPSRISKNDEERVRKALIAATNGNSIDKLEKAIGEFEQQGLWDNGDLSRARSKLVQLHLQKLRKATLDRKLEELETTINGVKQSHVALQVIDSKEFTDAEATRLQLRRLKLYMHKVLALNKATVAEMHSYQRPRPLVHQVMKATFRILGEPNTKLKNWPYVQSSMRQLGRRSMLSRIKNCDVVHLKQRQVDDAEAYLADTNKHLVRMCSAGAGTFYVWSNNMISEYQGKSDFDPLVITSTTNKWDKGVVRRKKGNPNDSAMASQMDTFRSQSKGNDSLEVESDGEGEFSGRNPPRRGNIKRNSSRYSDQWDQGAVSVRNRKSRH